MLRNPLFVSSLSFIRVITKTRFPSLPRRHRDTILPRLFLSNRMSAMSGMNDSEWVIHRG